MSEIKLNVLDSHTLLTATVHGSVGDALVAALSTEPETIDELETALQRFQKCDSIPASSKSKKPRGPIDEQPWDAGILVIDLAARIIACKSTYSLPTHKGKVNYHNGNHSTRFPLRYLLSDDWFFAPTIGNYQHHADRRIEERGPALDSRAVLYGEPLLKFIVDNVQLLDVTTKRKRKHHRESVVDIHRRWLMTPRDDLNSKSVRDVVFEKRELVDFDLESRMLQWSYFLEEPPALSKESHGYRFAGYGSHEWVMYYHLVRFLIWEAVDLKIDRARHANHLQANDCCRAKSVITPVDRPSPEETSGYLAKLMQKLENKDGSIDVPTTPTSNNKAQPSNAELLIYLADLQASWLTTSNRDLDGYVPLNVIDNERQRRPEAMTGRSMVVDEDCPCCKMMGDESEAGEAIYFCHFDGCNMEDEFAFSRFATHEEWEAEQREFEQRSRKSESERDESATFTDDCEIPF